MKKVSKENRHSNKVQSDNGTSSLNNVEKRRVKIAIGTCLGNS